MWMLTFFYFISVVKKILQEFSDFRRSSKTKNVIFYIISTRLYIYEFYEEGWVI